MGCDIKIYIEHKDKGGDKWYVFGGAIYPTNYYELFAKLADVRNDGDIIPIDQPRGIPESSRLKEIYERDDDYRHSGSWCTVEEMELAITEVFENHYDKLQTTWKALLTLGQLFRGDGEDVRYVFWFDQ